MFKVSNRQVRLCLYGLLLGSTVTLSSAAEDFATRVLREQQQTLRTEQERLRIERWQRRQEPVEHHTERQPPVHADTQCWRLDGIRLRGNRRLDEHTLRQALQPLLTACVGVEGINRILRALTARYVAAGYPTSRPTLLGQPEDGAPLDIFIDEGFVERIELADPTEALSLRGAFPGVLGEPLYLPQLEQGLDQLNRLRAFEFGLDVLPGELQGGSRIRLHNRQPDKRWHLDARLDNRGTAYGGRHRLNLTFGLDSPLGLNGDLRLYAQRLVFHAPGQSLAWGGSYSLPYGAWTFAGFVAQSQHETPIPQTRLRSHGATQLLGANVERLLWRGQRGLLSSALRVSHKRLHSDLNGWRIDVQSPQLLTADLGVNLLWRGPGLWYASLGLGYGQSVSDDPKRRSAAPRFNQYRASLLHRRALSADASLSLQSQIEAQYSPDPLPAIEQLALNNDNAVRGFRERSVAAASGLSWRNELGQTFSLSWWPGLAVRPHLALDVGWARHHRAARLERRQGEVDSQRLIGAAVGLDLQLPGRQQLRLQYQRALHASDLPRHALEPGFWAVEWQLNL
ncbi:ShlB/FhaC/HecB family hemolysin secretion/activation protein [Pseudomonas phoenicis]|uniref:ShlB/FhaC/HecB family hemolysin secretion/activation protein n=1 Tax=unclassified Pseudomonas TaxID=196821 RepID=UPI00399F82C4